MNDFQPEPARFPDGSFVTPERMSELLSEPGAHIRQGDVLLIRKDKPQGAGLLPRENGSVVLAHGEVTGHMHQLRGPQVTHYMDSGHEYLTVKDRPELLVHEEHSAIPVSNGDFELAQQVRYTPEELVREMD